MERETKERPKSRVPKKAFQVGEEESLLGSATNITEVSFLFGLRFVLFT